MYSKSFKNAAHALSLMCLNPHDFKYVVFDGTKDVRYKNLHDAAIAAAAVEKNYGKFSGMVECEDKYGYSSIGVTSDHKYPPVLPPRHERRICKTSIVH